MRIIHECVLYTNLIPIFNQKAVVRIIHECVLYMSSCYTRINTGMCLDRVAKEDRG